MTNSVRVLVILQARYSSTRLPGKVLADLAGEAMILRQIERVRRARMPDGLVVATSDDASDDALAAFLSARGVAVYRGSLNDVLGRYAGALRLHPAQHVVRVTGDCPLADPDVIDAVVAHHLVRGADLTSNTNQATFPDGLDVEVIRAEAMFSADQEGKGQTEREHVTQFFYRRPERFRIEHYKYARDLAELRWTVDEPEDLAFVRAVFAALHSTNPTFSFQDVLRLIEAQPDIAAINAGFDRNEGLARSLAADGAKQGH